MGNNEQFDDQTVSIGLSRAEIREMARRQLVASVAVAVVIAIGAALVALAPASREVAGLASPKVAAVQQPEFVTNGRVASAKRFERELP